MKKTNRGASRQSLEAAISDLADALGRLVVHVASSAAASASTPLPAAKPALRREAPVATAPARAAKSKRPVTAARKKDLMFQGKYMAAIRSLGTADKNKVRTIRAQRGIEAAVALALRLAGKKK